jgi:hemolysin activation/secretion protein
MKSQPQNEKVLNFISKLIGCWPILVTMPALAESFALPTCPFPYLLQDEQSLLLDCTQVKPISSPPPKSQLKNSKQKSQSSVPETPISGSVVFGNTILTPVELNNLLSPTRGLPANQQTTCQIAQEVTQIYRDRGYVLAQVYPVLDRKTNAIVTKTGGIRFLVSEGCLESIDITGTQRLKPSYVKDRIAAGAQSPFNANKINDFLALIQTDPKLAKLEVLGLTPGKSFGSSTLAIKVTEANSLSGFVGVDTSIAPIFGGVRGIGGLTYRNVTGNGDDLSAFYFRSTTGEAQGADFSYQLPINPMNGQIQVRYAPSIASIVLQPNDRVFKSTTNTAELNYRQPLFRSPSKEFAVSVGFSFQDQQVSLDGISEAIIAGADNEGKTKTRVVQFSQDYTSLDDGGNWNLRSQFNFGLGGLGATNNTRPTPDGRFITWQGQAQRVQRLSPNNYAVAQLGFQLTPDPLLPSQQFTVAGDRSILGYRQSLRSSDNGVRLSFEDRAIVGRNETGEATLQLVGNVTAAKLWNNGAEVIDNSFLASAGVGVIWEPLPKLVTRLDYAIPLVRIGDRGNSFQDSGFNFSIGYGF